MQRIALSARPDLDKIAADQGFTFASMYGEAYWDETSAYAFTLDQVERDIEDPSTALHAMVLETVDTIIASEDRMSRMGINPAHWDLIAHSWRAAEGALYGRFDLVYDGNGPASMLEYNADTPTSLYEAGSFQWDWLATQRDRGILPATANQFNSLYEALVARWSTLLPANTDVHFAATADSPEDYATVEFLAYAAREAGLGAHFVDTNAIGLTTNGQLADDENRVIGTLFKLHPWEDVLDAPFAAHLATSQCRFVEPAWKALASNKAILPVLWELFEGHPNLLPAFYADDIHTTRYTRAVHAGQFNAGQVRKPLFSREGSSITITDGAGALIEASANTDYAHHPHILQAYRPLPVFDGWRPIIGSWIVGDLCAGMGIREDKAHITQDLSRFKPHYFL